VDWTKPATHQWERNFETPESATLVASFSLPNMIMDDPDLSELSRKALTNVPMSWVGQDLLKAWPEHGTRTGGRTGKSVNKMGTNLGGSVARAAGYNAARNFSQGGATLSTRSYALGHGMNKYGILGTFAKGMADKMRQSYEGIKESDKRYFAQAAEETRRETGEDPRDHSTKSTVTGAPTLTGSLGNRFKQAIEWAFRAGGHTGIVPFPGAGARDVKGIVEDVFGDIDPAFWTTMTDEEANEYLRKETVAGDDDDAIIDLDLVDNDNVTVEEPRRSDKVTVKKPRRPSKFEQLQAQIESKKAASDDMEALPPPAAAPRTRAPAPAPPTTLRSTNYPPGPSIAPAPASRTVAPGTQVTQPPPAAAPRTRAPAPAPPTTLRSANYPPGPSIAPPPASRAVAVYKDYTPGEKKRGTRDAADTVSAPAPTVSSAVAVYKDYTPRGMKRKKRLAVPAPTPAPFVPRDSNVVYRNQSSDSIGIAPTEQISPMLPQGLIGYTTSTPTKPITPDDMKDDIGPALMESVRAQYNRMSQASKQGYHNVLSSLRDKADSAEQILLFLQAVAQGRQEEWQPWLMSQLGFSEAEIEEYNRPIM